jgi:hypothetical protein
MEKNPPFFLSVIYHDINAIYGENAGSLNVKSGDVYTETTAL